MFFYWVFAFYRITNIKQQPIFFSVKNDCKKNCEWPSPMRPYKDDLSWYTIIYLYLPHRLGVPKVPFGFGINYYFFAITTLTTLQDKTHAAFSSLIMVNYTQFLKTWRTKTLKKGWFCAIAFTHPPSHSNQSKISVSPVLISSKIIASSYLLFIST